MKPSLVSYFHTSAISYLQKPWQKWRNGVPYYGLTKTGNKRVPLTTKQGNKNFYKGTRSSGIGRHTKHAHYVIEWNKVRTYVTPSIVNFDLKPYVSANVPVLRHEFQGFKKGPLDLDLYDLKIREYIFDGNLQSEGASDVECFRERG